VIKPNECECAYVAGLFDGEGSVYYRKLKQIKTSTPWQTRS